ncbi:uncharacterized protein F5891DRAFT_661841 [Suillus fuscotomentosus]|uniref:Zn(2)-C6 fungal-type domain-containing protein n=1 Tax=Suillus fuscotomentosus TaxID=1912939 RepID=A0AAD4DZK7_9AGAM|nr:uncharacterized protein F5891DRAFT_661841 [Suillus fuscotomentosus]KAG1895533.1 hypothetical protein F5891DRAFT_661841 [Suillus fuscotomentosus]
MTTELQPIRKKRTTSESNSTSDGDHRKRRRNRTTQSCLNCHTSKRMCDRKRPCGRCTQLGLTGLCVYEVDDPSQRTDVQDEGSRLRQRVAELEGVIRELKNKPHPRWVQAGSTPEVEFEKWHARSQSRSAAEQQPTEQQTEPQSTSPSRTDQLVSGPLDESHSSPRLLSPTHARPALTFSQPPVDLANTSASYSPYFSSISSPLSTPSPSIMTPTDEYAQNRALIVGEQPPAGEFDFASMFVSYPLAGYEDNLGHNNIADDTCRSKPCYDTFPHGHCHCLTEGSSYNVVLELSLRLRKAADILSRSAYHHLASNNCTLNQRIMELDAIATTTLGNIATPPNDVEQIYPQQHPFSHKSIPPSSTFDASSGRTMPVSTVSPHTLQGIRSWDIMSCVSDSSSICEDSFMSWDPSRRG